MVTKAPILQGSPAADADSHLLAELLVQEGKDRAGLAVNLDDIVEDRVADQDIVCAPAFRGEREPPREPRASCYSGLLDSEASSQFSSRNEDKGSTPGATANVRGAAAR